VIISGRKAALPNTQWFFDGGCCFSGDAILSGLGVSNALSSPSVIVTTNQYITTASNVAGYWSAGFDGGISGYSNFNSYATNGDVKFKGMNNWYIMATVDSYNGVRGGILAYQGGFLTWFSTNSFGGTNYSNTPICALGHVSEPGPGEENRYTYYRDWALGKPFVITAWDSFFTGQYGFKYCTAFGDPFVSQ
jgi:hypothetical protein